jgi:ATP-dependent helicase/nuclease subunit B
MTAAVFTISTGLPFVDTLAAGLLAETGGDPLALAAAEVLLPNRRACRALREAFLRLSEGRPLLLPRMRAVDAVDEAELELGADDPLDIPPAIAPLERRLLLTRLVLAVGGGRGGLPPSPDQAARLADELAGLLDAVQIERLSFDRLHDLVPDSLAEHWQRTVTFLELLTEAWPKILAERGLLDPQERVNRVLGAQTEAWRKTPPGHLVVAAGTTGSRPATADLLAVVAGLPFGRVVLPGLDQELDQAGWDAVDASHPQAGLKRLLERLGVERRDVRPFMAEASAPRAERIRLLSEALRPAATCEAWRALPKFSAASLDGVVRLDAPGPREEAGAIALMLRQALELDGRTAALVTPDRSLARRVAAELARWDLALDDSAGTPLALTEPGIFLRLVAEMVADGFSPHATLAALKHPLAAAGMDAAKFRAGTRRLELAALRGPRPAAGLAGLRAAAGDDAPAGWLDALDFATRPLALLMARDTAPLAELVRAHMECAEALAAESRLPGPARLWRLEAGEALAGFAAELLDSAVALGELPPACYPALLDALLAGAVVRPAWGSHPRLFLWGPMEARLQHADLVVLGGLNEGTWPPEAESDPWMSRPMRAAFGLAPFERRIGLSAHDFAQALGAPRVVLTRAVRVEGTPTVPSRWLLRLDAVMQAAGVTLREDGAQWLDWQAALDQPAGRSKAERPAPRPPVAARPRRLSVTEVETWMRDPYAIYARHILGLKALEPVDADPGAADYGSLVHRALERFLELHPGPLPADAEARLLAIGEEVFAPALARPGLWAFWWPRFRSVAAWFTAHERRRRPRLARTWCEAKGGLEIAAPAGPFLLHARADRVDLLDDGTLAVIDYKTGMPPRKREVAAGFAPQLPLEAAIAGAGGFAGIDAAPVSELLFWRLKGDEDGGDEIAAGDDPARLAAEAAAGLAALVAAFDDERTPYEARPHPEMAPKYSDFLHLARVREWASAGEDGEE